MKINYVVPFYIIDGNIDGSRNNIYHRIDKFFAVKCHLDTLNRINPSNVVKATFVINRSDFVNEGDIEKIVGSNNRIPIEVKYRDNWGYSYGAWEYQIRDSLDQDYDYYFLTEDDYIFTVDKFHEPFLKKFTDKTAFVCGLGQTNGHPSVSYGLYSAKVCKDVLNEHGEIFESYNARVEAKTSPYNGFMGYPEWQGYYHNHFLKSGYTFTDITDISPTVFKRCVYGVGGEPVILPLL